MTNYNANQPLLTIQPTEEFSCIWPLGSPKSHTRTQCDCKTECASQCISPIQHTPRNDRHTALTTFYIVVFWFVLFFKFFETGSHCFLTAALEPVFLPAATSQGLGLHTHATIPVACNKFSKAFLLFERREESFPIWEAEGKEDDSMHWAANRNQALEWPPTVSQN